MKSPRCESSSSPIGVSSETGSWRHLQDLAHLLGGDAHLLADLLRACGSRPRSCSSWRWMRDELVDRLDHVHGDADRPGLVGDRARDRLADPPRRVRRELVALGVVELLDRADQPEVPLLDQVEEQHAATDVPLRDRDDEAQVRLDQLALGELAVAFDAAQEVDQLLAGLRPVGLARSASRPMPSTLPNFSDPGARGSRRRTRSPGGSASGRPVLLRRSSSLSSVANSPASIRRARSTSWAAVSSGTLPISFRYIRTGSFVGAFRRSTSSSALVADASTSSPGTSMTSIPSPRRCSSTWVRNSSTCSGVKSSTGNRFEQVVGGHEAAFTPSGGDRAPSLLQAPGRG